MSEEANARKARSEAVLLRKQIPINKHLPVIETSEARLRSKPEIAYRSLALLAAALKAEGLEQHIFERVLSKYALAPYFTSKESAFIEQQSPSEKERAQFAWRYEAAWVLLWALSYIENIGEPSAICDVPKAVSIMRDRSTEQFIAEASLRSLAQVLDETDLIYRYHWAAVDARINGKPCPEGVDLGVVYERHYALNWLIGYLDQAWDDVTTDT